jgi:hypothetical protein
MDHAGALGENQLRDGINRQFSSNSPRQISASLKINRAIHPGKFRPPTLNNTYRISGPAIELRR